MGGAGPALEAGPRPVGHPGPISMPHGFAARPAARTGASSLSPGSARSTPGPRRPRVRGALARQRRAQRASGCRLRSAQCEHAGGGFLASGPIRGRPAGPLIAPEIAGCERVHRVNPAAPCSGHGEAVREWNGSAGVTPQPIGGEPRSCGCEQQRVSRRRHVARPAARIPRIGPLGIRAATRPARGLLHLPYRPVLGLATVESRLSRVRVLGRDSSTSGG